MAVATKPRPWPNNAEAARMDCISLARAGRKALLGELERVTDAQTLRAMARAMEAFREIEAKLNQCRRTEE